jgi:hypothetical protein
MLAGNEARATQFPETVQEHLGKDSRSSSRAVFQPERQGSELICFPMELESVVAEHGFHSRGHLPEIQETNARTETLGPCIPETFSKHKWSNHEATSSCRRHSGFHRSTRTCTRAAGWVGKPVNE